MRKIANIIIFSILLFSCNKKEKNTLEGELIIKLIDFVNLKNFPNEEYSQTLNRLDSLIKSKGHLSENDKYLINLKENGLLKSPYFYISNDSIKNYAVVFINEKQYLKIKKYDYNYLINNNKINFK